MRSLIENKRWIILVSVLALGALTMLAISLDDVPFREAQVFDRNDPRQLSAVPLSMINSIVSVPFWKQVSVWILLVFMMALIAVLLSPELRWRLIKTIIRVAVTYWALYIFFTRYRESLVQIGLNLTGVGDFSTSPSNGKTIPEFAPPQTVSFVSYLVSFGIAVLLIILARKVYGFWTELNALVPESPLRKIAGIARSSLHDLSSGRESSDVIMNCYYRMTDVVSERRRLKRGEAVTPNEFAYTLEQAGLPADPVRRLTRMFESVRYGGHTLGTPEINEAVACLTTILRHCGEAG
jgi:hypothetical protein